MIRHARRQFLANLIRATLGVTATCVVQPLMADQQPNDFDTFMKFSPLLVWYKGDITSINPTGDDVRIAYIHALKWKAMGIPVYTYLPGSSKI